MHEGEWMELLHRAMTTDEPDSEWRGRAPQLWPAVGRNYMPDQVLHAAGASICV